MYSKGATRSPLVNISPRFSDDGTLKTWIVDESFDRNQWYFTAMCFEQGVIFGMVDDASLQQASLSPNTLLSVIPDNGKLTYF